jgi:NADH:ubiquinone oxidoreductase subunit
MEANDPWTWSVDDVITQLSGWPIHFRTAGCDLVNLPPFAALADKIRAQDINGTALLANPADDFLRHSLGIRECRQRKALQAVIGLLQSRSAKYQEHCATTGVRALNLEGGSTQQQFGNTYNETHVNDETGRKRRRVMFNTAPLQNGNESNIFGGTQSSRPFALQQNPPATGNNEWDYLLSRHNEKDDELVDESEDQQSDHEGESESDDDDSSEGVEIEGPDVPVPQGQRPKKLSRDQIIDIVNDEIAQFTHNWYPGKLGEDDRSNDEDLLDVAWDANALWYEFQAQDVEERDRVLEETNINIEVYVNRVDLLCEGILKSDWRTEAAVRQQCRALEVMVGWLEQEKWELSVYKMKTAPPKVDFNSIPIQETFRNVAHEVGRSTTLSFVEGRQGPPRQRAPFDPGEIIDLGSGSETSESPGEAQQDNGIPYDYDLVDAEASQATPVELESSEYVPLDAVITSPPPVIPSVDTANDLADQLAMAAHAVQSPQSSNNTPRKRGRPPKLSRPGPGRPSTSPAKDSQTIRRTIAQPRPMSLSPPPPHSSIRTLDSPSEASFATVSKWTWDELTSSRDRKRIILKILSEMSAADRTLIRARTTSLSKHDLLAELPECVAMLVRGEHKISGVLPRDLIKIVKFTRLFLSWWLADDFFAVGKGKELTQQDLRVLAKELNQGSKDPETFYNWLVYVLKHTFSEEALRRPEQPSAAEVIVISDDENPTPVPSRVTRNRKEKEKSLGGNKANERKKRGRASDTFSAVTLQK